MTVVVSAGAVKDVYFRRHVPAEWAHTRCLLDFDDQTRYRSQKDGRANCLPEEADVAKPVPRSGMDERSAKAKRRGRAELSGRSRVRTRRHARFDVNLPVRCTRTSAKATESWRGRTANVSRGGLAVELPRRLAPATTVAVEVRTGIGPLRVEAEVVWTRRMTGRSGIVRHGLSFAHRSDLLDLPVGALLGEWLRGRAHVKTRPLADIPDQRR